MKAPSLLMTICTSLSNLKAKPDSQHYKSTYIYVSEPHLTSKIVLLRHSTCVVAHVANSAQEEYSVKFIEI